MKPPTGSLGRGALAGPLGGILLGAGYGLVARLVFGFPMSQGGASEKVFGILSLSFFLLVPIGLGALSVAALREDLRCQWWTWLMAPAAACLTLLLGLAVTLLEGAICIVMAAPVFLLLSVVGGVLMGVLVRVLPRRRSAAVLALLPFVTSPVELRRPAPEMEREVVVERIVAAPPETLWREVIRVPEIREDELGKSFFTRIGIPRPLEAILDHEGPGATRFARFREGIAFREPIAVWEENRRLGFRIVVDPGSIAPDVLDDHVRVGSAHFDVTWGEFRLEPVDAGHTRLVLLSRERLRTRFNGYAALWTDAVMRDLQERICSVIARRAERAGTGS